MARKQLSPEEIVKLHSSPQVASVTSSKICFTPEFKKTLYDGLSSGKTVRIVLEEHGIDPEILGEQRLKAIVTHLRKYAKRDEGFEDLRKYNGRRPPKKTREQTLVTRVEQLEHELAYTRQEVEFLKKIRKADLEAQKLWESKHRQK